jgi:hypothetical protein
MYPGDERRCLTLTDADDVGLVTTTTGADVDVVMAGLDRISTASADCRVVVTSGVAIVGGQQVNLYLDSETLLSRNVRFHTEMQDWFNQHRS